MVVSVNDVESLEVEEIKFAAESGLVLLWDGSFNIVEPKKESVESAAVKSVEVELKNDVLFRKAVIYILFLKSPPQV
jgi:hypothetical protein